VVALPISATSVALGAPIRVMRAARLIFPILTTFSLVGALLGAGYFASDSGVNLARLWDSLFKPLLASRVLALLGALVLYPLFRLGRP
jgi:PiT family inorganic phosphate transporter